MHSHRVRYLNTEFRRVPHRRSARDPADPPKFSRSNKISEGRPISKTCRLEIPARVANNRTGIRNNKVIKDNILLKLKGKATRPPFSSLPTDLTLPLNRVTPLPLTEILLRLKATTALLLPNLTLPTLSRNIPSSLRTALRLPLRNLRVIPRRIRRVNPGIKAPAIKLLRAVIPPLNRP